MGDPGRISRPEQVQVDQQDPQQLPETPQQILRQLEHKYHADELTKEEYTEALRELKPDGSGDDGSGGTVPIN